MNSQFNHIILGSLISCPLIGALAIGILPRRDAKPAALVVAIINFLFSLHLVMHWNEPTGVTNSTSVAQGFNFHFEEAAPWIKSFGLNYHLGVDGISVFLVLLTAFLTPLLILSSWNAIQERAKEFFILLLILEAAAIGAFCALDLILFYVFFEATLIPTYLLISGWGGARRSYAALKFFMYTMFGSVLMWIAILYVYFQQPATSRSFDYAPMLNAARSLPSGTVPLLLFGAFALAFAIKSPLFPLHTWLPDAYVEAPTAATVMLASILSKMGVYGFIRFAIPFFPQAARDMAPLLIGLSIIGIIYGALVAIAQTDIKRLLAYSSLSHVGFILLGVFSAVLAGTYGPVALSGATLQMANHGITTGALFLLAGLLFERRDSREVGSFGGLAGVMPRYTVFFWVALFASIGLPGLNGFVGEYLIMQGAMDAGFIYAALAATGVIWGAVYMLRMFRATMFGEPSEANRFLLDIGRRETVVLALLLALTVWIGVAPQKFLNIINPDALRANDALRGVATPAVAQLPK